jgi:hypothetical protein
VFGLGKKRAVEQEMADWLAHPMEFGVPPKTVRLKRTYRGEVITQGAVTIHLVEYEMPDGTLGRGFVNGSLTWSFPGDDINAIADDDLMVAYCGWAWLFPATQAGNVPSEFESLTEERAFTEKKLADGFADVQLGSRYQIGTSELFEFKGTSNGQQFVGAGNTESEVVFAATDPKAALPPIYFLLGREVIKSMR